MKMLNKCYHVQIVNYVIVYLSICQCYSFFINGVIPSNDVTLNKIYLKKQFHQKLLYKPLSCNDEDTVTFYDSVLTISIENTFLQNVL